MLLDNISIILAICIAPFLLYFLYQYNKYYLNTNIKKNGLKFTWCSPGSAANPPPDKHINGHIWTNVDQIKKVSNENNRKKDPIFIDNFDFFEDYIKDAELPSILKNQYKKTSYYLDPMKLCRSMLIVGSAGSGKTEFIHNILQQDWYDKAIIFSKKFDFEPIYYKGSSFDILVNPKIKNCVIHNILDEDMEYIEVFTETIKNAKLGEDNNDFFSSSAKQYIDKFLQKVKIEAEVKDLTTVEKWELFLKTFEDEYNKLKNGKQKSLMDVMETVKIIINPMFIMAYRIIEGAPTFTAKDFFNKNEPCKIFLSANDPSIEGVVAATYSVLTKYQLSLKNNWCKRPVLHLQDEYNSLKEMMPERILVEQREVGRSKMFATLIGVQGLSADVKISQELLINMQYLVVFGGTDTSTLNRISEMIGDVEYEIKQKNESYSNQGKSTSYSVSKQTQKVISNYHINVLQHEGFSHLFISLKEKLLFKGYTPQVPLRVRDFEFNQINLNQFYKWKDERENNASKNEKYNSDVADSILASLEKE